MPTPTPVVTRPASPTVQQPEQSPTPSVTATPEPTSPSWIAFYAAASGEDNRVFALVADGSAVDLGYKAPRRAAVSPNGEWLATARDEHPADAIVISNLETTTTLTIPVTSELDSYGMVFDADGHRLAFLELGPPETQRTPWALVIVDLADGSTNRFRAEYGQDDDNLPANPVGWVGDELLVNAFVPFTEVGSAGVWAITLPAGLDSGLIEDLDRRQILPGDKYLFSPRLSPDGDWLLYLGRDYDYAPENYGPLGYDLVVNQLGLVDLQEGSSGLVVEETEGGALGGDVAWSPDGELALFAEGLYGDGSFESLTLKTVDDAGTVAEVGPVPLPSDGFLVSMDWCALERGLVVVATDEGVHELHRVDLDSGKSSLVVSEDRIEVLGCVRTTAAAEQGNADVVSVQAVQTAGPSPGSGETTWTFHVTVEHPDTGWEDYADGWDVVTPDGQVLKPDIKDDFTRTLLHPHVEEQPFTRSQSGIVVPTGVTQVRVRAHDIVDGYGGQEIVVDLSESSGPGFEVEHE